MCTVSELIKVALRMSRMVFKSVAKDNLKIRSGCLAYVTLLSFVPLLSVMVSVFSIFPLFQDIYAHLEALIYRIFVPNTSEVVRYHLEVFLNNASKVSLWGLVALIFLSFVLMSAAENALNAIFRVKASRQKIHEKIANSRKDLT